MADMNAGIILAGEQPNFLATIDASNQAVQRQIQARRETDYANMLRANGPGIMNGDRSAMNALAQFDPQAALGVQQSRLQMDATRQDMGFSAERMQMAREQARQAVAEHAARMSAAEREQEAAKIEQGLSGAAYFYEKGDRAGYDAFARSHGLDPAQVPFDQFPAVAAQFSGALEALKTFKAMDAPPDPTAGAPQGYMWQNPNDHGAGVSPLPGYSAEPKDDYGRYVQEEKTAGRSPLSRLEFMQAQKGKGFAVTTPDGTTVTYGGAQPVAGDSIAVNPADVDTAISMIDQISSDPNLDAVTGPVEGQGGNNVDDLGMARSLYYGGKGVSLIEKIGQLQGSTWLAARSMLKGGGAITDYESRKAEGAMARLSRVKDAAEFKAALQDLKDAIIQGRDKLRAAGKLPAVEQQEQSDDDLLKLYGGK